LLCALEQTFTGRERGGAVIGLYPGAELDVQHPGCKVSGAVTDSVSVSYAAAGGRSGMESSVRLGSQSTPKNAVVVSPPTEFDNTWLAGPNHHKFKLLPQTKAGIVAGMSTSPT